MERSILLFLAAYNDFWNAIDGQPEEEFMLDDEPEPIENITRIVVEGGSKDARLRWPISFQAFARWLPMLAARSNCELTELDDETRNLLDKHLGDKSRGFYWEDLPYVDDVTRNEDFHHWEFLNVQGPAGRVSYLISCSPEDAGTVVRMDRSGGDGGVNECESPEAWLQRTTDQLKHFTRERRDMA
ncbi:hypothetical protein PROFUN_02412 [Planoprotostelium fungivorum]|uniref:Uncharacterized protein n=1 Tax=Planoprotostelium fungivorum TaxID=1890364 RepID=A0A2P6NUR4_9EUKA|nr:hypothetical protein PROFUN_02412 [Planoprotostelium fungivorum]